MFFTKSELMVYFLLGFYSQLWILHTFRHCKALREYHKTKDILHVMYVLGHKSLLTTQRYVGLYKQVYNSIQTNRFITKIASTKKERCELINDGWILVSKDGDDWYFKNRNSHKTYKLTPVFDKVTFTNNNTNNLTERSCDWQINHWFQSCPQAYPNLDAVKEWCAENFLQKQPKKALKDAPT